MKDTQSSFGRPMHVLFYSHSGDVSGAEISLLLTMKHLTGVHSVLAAPQGELLTRAEAEGFEIIPIRSHRARMSNNPWQTLRGVIGTASAGLRLRRIVRSQKPDIVHANSIRAGLIALVGTWRTSTKVVWHVRDNLPNNLVGRIIRRLAQYLVDCVFVISNAIAENFATTTLLRDKTFVVHNGIDESQAFVGRSLRDEMGTSNDCFVIGVVGQIAPWKRQHDAIDAFSEFHQNVPNSELWIVGEPKFRKENVQYAEELEVTARQLGMSESVRFLGFRTDVINVMASIDTLLVPSENEPFGRVVIEAMLVGKPVVGTRGGGIPEIVLDDVTGYLVDMGDVFGMTERLRNLYVDRSTAAQMGERGKARVYQTFSIQSKIEQIYAAYVELISKLPARRASNEETTYRLGG